MKRTSIIFLLGILIGVICIYQQPWLSESVSVADNEHNSIVTPTLPIEGFRPSIAFILGEDKEADNPYYQESLLYYTNHPKGKTDFVVSTCRSLEEVKSYLPMHAEMNAQPWGDIHLVSHGNQWSGLSVKVAPDSKRTTTQRIMENIHQDGFEFLPSSVVDDLSQVFIHSCGVGNDEELIDAIRLYLGCPQSLPTVYAPRLFEFYTSDDAGKHSQKYLANNWMVNYRLGERPSDFILMNELREKYNDASVDWHGALERNKPRWLGDAYHFTFDVPVKWIVPVDSVINFYSEEQQTKWLNDQKEITNELKRLNLPMEKFKWTLAKGYAENKDDVKKPAISVKGYCTILCVVQALIEDNMKNTTAAESAAPEITNFRYYYKATTPLLATNDKHEP